VDWRLGGKASRVAPLFCAQQPLRLNEPPDRDEICAAPQTPPNSPPQLQPGRDASLQPRASNKHFYGSLSLEGRGQKKKRTSIDLLSIRGIGFSNGKTSRYSSPTSEQAAANPSPCRASATVPPRRNLHVTPPVASLAGGWHAFAIAHTCRTLFRSYESVSYVPRYFPLLRYQIARLRICTAPSGWVS
jgi:hypothetical protein